MLEYPSVRGTLILDKFIGNAGDPDGPFQRLRVISPTRPPNTILDLSEENQAMILDRSIALAVSPDAAYLVVFRLEDLGQASDGGPARQIRAFVGIEEGGWVEFQRKDGRSVNTDSLIEGWAPDQPHTLLVNHLGAIIPALPLGEAIGH